MVLRPAPNPTDNEEAIRENLESWNTMAPLHAQGSGTEFYRIEQWLAGESTLSPWEIEELGSVEGKSLLHMQCHIGTDTLSWAQEGARVTGLDFAPNAVAEAKRFADILGFKEARFVVSRVRDAVETLEEELFDIIYTGRGALCWLPDLREWARICSALLKHDGVLYLEESTPLVNMLDTDEGPDGTRLVPKHDLFQKGPIAEVDGCSYATTETECTLHFWEYRYDTLINALITNGFHLDFLNERDELFFVPWPDLFEPSRPNHWRLKKENVPIPLSFTLKATRQ